MRAPTIAAARKLGLTVGAAVLLSLGLRHALLALGRALAASLGRGHAGTLALAAVELCLSLIAVALAARLLRRAPRFAVAAVAAVLALHLGAGYAESLHERRPGAFAGLATYPPHDGFHDDFPGRPALDYRTNALGFREPEIAVEKAPGVLRVALVGDSYVFGMGVPLDGTLSAHLSAELARRGARAEVLNLGLPGHNLATHVTLYAAAGTHLHADVAVVCLTLPNDLSTWDSQDERRDASRPSLYSAARHFLGTAAAPALWGRLLLSERVTPEGLAHLDDQAARLAVLARSPGAPRLFLFPFRPAEPEVERRLAAVEGARRIAPPLEAEGDFIPGDGHPTSAGNRRFAAHIAAAVLSR